MRVQMLSHRAHDYIEHVGAVSLRVVGCWSLANNEWYRADATQIDDDRVSSEIVRSGSISSMHRTECDPTLHLAWRVTDVSQQVHS